MRNPESLRLYRDILRASRSFFWRNEKGDLWSDVLKKNARQEFEQARHETDKLVIAQLIFVGRDCLEQTKGKLDSAAAAVRDNVDKTRTS
jgi:hypothetical protein